MYKNIFKLACIPLVVSMFVLPATASAESKAHQNQMNPNHQSNLVHQYKVKKNNNYYYAPQDQQVAYLYAIIAQLQAQLATLQANRPNSYPYTNAGYASTRDISRVLTGGVEADDTDDSVWFDGEVMFARDAEARVWFEYGTNTNLPYSTASITIDGDARETQEFELEATNLADNNVYYYRLVAQDEDGKYVEGVMKSFRFDGRNTGDDDDNNNNNDNNDNDWSLEVDDDTYETGDNVRVKYEVENEDNKNWIGLYEIGDNDNSYITRTYVDDEEGSVTFRINTEGEYEFRLFDEDGDEQATSDEFEVED